MLNEGAVALVVEVGDSLARIYTRPSANGEEHTCALLAHSFKSGLNVLDRRVLSHLGECSREGVVFSEEVLDTRDYRRGGQRFARDDQDLWKRVALAVSRNVLEYCEKLLDAV